MLREAYARHAAMLRGVRSYLRHPVPARPAEPEAVWSLGSARLLHYPSPAGNGRPVLLVPSLINRPYILDLTERRSLARHLARQGNEIYLLDWGAPDDEERRFALADYVTRRLSAGADWIVAQHKTAPTVIGYCMGGLLAMALAITKPQKVGKLGLIAVPWDFHAADRRSIRISDEAAHKATRWIAGEKEISGELILQLFYWCDPWRFDKKFAEFDRLESEKAKDYFAAVEGWANDCVPLSAPVANDCLINWLHHNQLMKGEWQVHNETILPERIACPLFIAAAQYDRIVTPGAAAPLLARVSDAKIVKPPSGHIGMITGARRKTQLWEPLTRFIAA